LRQGWQPLCITISVTVDDIEVAALDVTELSHPLQKGVDKPYGGPTSAPTQPGNEWPLLRACREWPRHCCAAEQRDELAAVHCPAPPVLPNERNSTPRCCCAAGFQSGLRPLWVICDQGGQSHGNSADDPLPTAHVARSTAVCDSAGTLS